MPFQKGNKCGKKFKKGIIPWNKDKKGYSTSLKGRKLSKEHRKNLSKVRIGKFCEKNNPNWKGGKIKYGSKNRYWAIFHPLHPFADSKGYVMEHRLVMEQMLERYLKPEERVHHINKVTIDNRKKNLQLFPNFREHLKFHRTIKK